MNNKKNLNEIVNNEINMLNEKYNDFKYIKPTTNEKLVNISNKNHINGKKINKKQLDFIKSIDITLNEKTKNVDDVVSNIEKISNLFGEFGENKINGELHYPHHIFKHYKKSLKLCTNEKINYKKLNDENHIINLKLHDLKTLIVTK